MRYGFALKALGLVIALSSSTPGAAETAPLSASPVKARAWGGEPPDCFDAAVVGTVLKTKYLYEELDPKFIYLTTPALIDIRIHHHIAGKSLRSRVRARMVSHVSPAEEQYYLFYLLKIKRGYSVIRWNYPVVKDINGSYILPITSIVPEKYTSKIRDIRYRIDENGGAERFLDDNGGIEREGHPWASLRKGGVIADRGLPLPNLTANRPRCLSPP